MYPSYNPFIGYYISVYTLDWFGRYRFIILRGVVVCFGFEVSFDIPILSFEIGGSCFLLFAFLDRII